MSRTHYDRNGYRIDEPSQAQLLRRRLTPPPLKAGLYNFAAFLEWAATNNQPTRPIGVFETKPPLAVPLPVSKEVADEEFGKPKPKRR